MPTAAGSVDHLQVPGAASSDQINAGCLEKVGGCEVTGTLQIATNLVPDQHELMHAYMELVAPGANPVPFVVEGAAQAIGCEGLQVGVGRPGRSGADRCATLAGLCTCGGG